MKVRQFTQLLRIMFWIKLSTTFHSMTGPQSLLLQAWNRYKRIILLIETAESLFKLENER